MLGQNLDEECLAQIVSVFLAGLVADAEDFGHFFIIDLLTGVVDKMPRNLPESLDVADFVAALDVFLQNGVDQALDITSFVPQALEFGKAARGDVVNERALAGCFSFCGDARSVYLME